MKNNVLSILFILILLACNNENQGLPGNSGSGNSGSGNSGGGGNNSWLIPQDEVFDGGPGKDGIPALTNPNPISLDQADYLSDDDLVLGYSNGENHRAYPHDILDWHEIINDELDDNKIAVTYCPLTGTGIGWSRSIAGEETTFGVSGLLYNTNLIPYDRGTDSNWCQISLTCVNGSLQGEKIESFHLIETTFKTWKSMFPNSSVLSTNTGFTRNYGRYPYGAYRTNNDLFLFPVSPKDERLPAKERVLTVLNDENAKVYRFNQFENGGDLLSDQYDDLDLIIIGDKDRNFMVAFKNDLNGSTHQFSYVSNGSGSVVFKDELGNQYDLFGKIVDGPNKGNILSPVTSFMAYWFSIGAFYPAAKIYGHGN